MEELLERTRPSLRPQAERGETRTLEQLREHYEIERELADRLRNAPYTVRRVLYPLVYDELLKRVPHHPRLRARLDPGHLARRAQQVAQQAGFIRKFLSPRRVLMEVGAGDCALTLALAPYAERAYAVEVSEQILAGVKPPPNVRLVLSDGISMPVPEGSIDLAVSDQLMEHLHPEDALAQLKNIFRSLAPGGRYFCITPNRHYGPCDISGYFDAVPRGMHLREYGAGELRALLLACGFSAVRFYAGARGVYTRVPYAAVRLLECALAPLPYRLRRRIAGLAPLRAALGLRVMAVK
jgi:SAM-dependent methyltransferase